MPEFSPDIEVERDRLLKMLEERRAEITVLHRYYAGDHDLPKLPEKCSNDIKRLREDSLLNLCPMVVDSVTERLEVTGFTFGTNTTSPDQLDVWADIWQANQLDAIAPLVHQEALIAKRSFILVWPNEDGTAAEVTPETPDEFLIDYVPGSRGKRRYAIKHFCEGDGQKKVSDVTLWSTDGVWVWTRKGSGDWQPDEERSGDNPFGEVPAVEFRSLPNLRGEPHSELGRGVLRVQDRINKTVFDRLVLQEYQAFPQRYATGVAVETDQDGNAINPIETGPNKISVPATEPGKDAKLGQWDAADLSPHLKAVEADIHAMAAMTKTPVYYLAAEFSNVSADAIRAAEAGLVKKAIGHQRIFGESWEDVVRLSLKATNDPRSSDLSSFVAWLDPETRTVAEAADAASKVWGKIPNAEVWRRYFGATEQQITQWPAAVAQQALAARIAATPIPTAVPAVA